MAVDVVVGIGGGGDASGGEILEGCFSKMSMRLRFESRLPNNQSGFNARGGAGGATTRTSIYLYIYICVYIYIYWIGMCKSWVRDIRFSCSIIFSLLSGALLAVVL
jgi:hypothetical protein